MPRVSELFRRLARDESGQGLVEYVLIIALVAIGLVLAMTVFRNQIGKTFDNITGTLSNAPGTPYSPGS